MAEDEKETYIDDAFFVPHQKVAEEPGLMKIPQPYHVIHPLHRGGVHGLQVDLLADLVLLRTRCRRINMTSTERPSRCDLTPFPHRRSGIAVQHPSP